MSARRKAHDAQVQAPEAVRYVGQPNTRQIWGRWLEPGELFADAGSIAAFRDLPDFEIVNTTLPPTEPEALDDGDGE